MGAVESAPRHRDLHRSQQYLPNDKKAVEVYGAIEYAMHFTPPFSRMGPGQRREPGAKTVGGARSE